MQFPKTTPAIVIVGAGLAGLYCALKLAPLRATVISPVALGSGASSAWAQGGMAAAVGEGDTPERHAADTAAAGGGIVDEKIAVGVARDASACVRDLLSIGVPFDQDAAGAFVQSREAAHTKHRVVRVSGDRAGHAIMQALIAKVRKTPSIEVIEGATVLDLDRDEHGITGLKLGPTNGVSAPVHLTGVHHVVLATGGVGGLYAVTTNPETSTGRGIAIAARAGAVIADAEFVQFHPTAIAVDADPAPLASEALRGEGALLVNGDGERFMAAAHPDQELAPRDVVARAVFNEIAAGRGAFLDCREAIGAAFPEHFPTVYQMCVDYGIDPVRDLIPVAPAEHYHMGGVKTDASGATTVAGLWAVGEVASTGLHGANRLASNSLLEAVVFARRVAEAIANAAPRGADGASADAQVVQGHGVADSEAHVEARERARQRIRQTMSAHVGVVRDAAGLRQALQTLGEIQAGSEGDLEIENMAIAARFIAEAALRRRESRGAHARRDFPMANAAKARRESITLAGLGLRDSLSARSVLSEIAQSGKLTT